MNLKNIEKTKTIHKETKSTCSKYKNPTTNKHNKIQAHLISYNYFNQSIKINKIRQKIRKKKLDAKMCNCMKERRKEKL